MIARGPTPAPTDADVPAPPPLLLDVAGVAKITGLSIRSWWRLVSAQEAPAPVTIPGTRCTRWRYADVAAWVESLEGGR
jgi:predicted DNA-binding transcriptional regulator AlpA